MEFQEWYEKNEKELYKEFANIQGWSFNVFCQREFDRGTDWPNANEKKLEVKN